MTSSRLHGDRRTRVLLAVVCTVVVTALWCPPIAAQVGWRFGFEWNENWPWSPPWDHPSQKRLLGKLEQVGRGGGINVNGMRGWATMQPWEGAPIDFAPSDTVVRLFQDHGFSVTWYLDCDARWAWVNPDAHARLASSMAPAPDKEDDWQAFVRAVVERYDGDGVDDMPGLRIPIRFYVMTGEVKFDKTGLGDREDPPFWADTIEHLLRLHRLTYEAVHQADPSGLTKVVSSGAILWDLYADFPDYPAFDPADPSSTIRRRLTGENFKRSTYAGGFDDLKTMLDSFGNDADGVECDYVGWHPHFGWRVIDQEFALIRAHAGPKPIYVDDMWSNLFPVGYAAIPGEAQFNARQSPNRDWVAAINGDFPNTLFVSADPYGELFQKLSAGDPAVLRWYDANGARGLVKSFCSAFGEGAERASYSGTNDTLLLGLFRNWELGWINLLGIESDGYPEKPQYYTLGLLVEKLADFTSVTEIPVSADPRTRVYRFDRPRGPVYVCWSETGGPPPSLDYRVATGETVSFEVGVEEVHVTHPVDDVSHPSPVVETLPAQEGRLTIRLGYEPIIVEPIGGTPPLVRVLSPNGGEKARAGRTLTLSWEATDDQGVVAQDIHLSSDSGATYSLAIATGLAGDVRSYTWAIPATLSKGKRYRVEVVARDAAGMSSTDASDGDFRIRKARVATRRER